MYPGPAPLLEIFLVELLGDNIKVDAVEVGADWKHAVEEGWSKTSRLQGDVESGSQWTGAGDRRMLVAGKSSTFLHVFSADRGSIWLGGDLRQVADGHKDVYSDWREFRRTRLPAKVDA
jgi:hypothetical protein